jgi:hypothetical protein
VRPREKPPRLRPRKKPPSLRPHKNPLRLRSRTKPSAKVQAQGRRPCARRCATPCSQAPKPPPGSARCATESSRPASAGPAAPAAAGSSSFPIMADGDAPQPARRTGIGRILGDNGGSTRPTDGPLPTLKALGEAFTAPGWTAGIGPRRKLLEGGPGEALSPANRLAPRSVQTRTLRLPPMTPIGTDVCPEVCTTAADSFGFRYQREPRTSPCRTRVAGLIRHPAALSAQATTKGRLAVLPGEPRPTMRSGMSTLHPR